MAYIQPNSTIEFFGDLNISPSYENTLYFESEWQKDAYFGGLPKLAYVPICTYNRENRGYVRVQLPMRTLIGATYMRFKNASFENKWFYAFVKNVNYINNETTEVQFEIDKYMTWAGTFKLNECYIERQHTLNDGIGNNICNEGISFGEYVIEGRDFIDLGIDRIVMVYLPAAQTAVQGALKCNIYSGYNIAVYASPADINNDLTSLLQMNLIENVVAIYMCKTEITRWNDYHKQTVEFDKPYDSLNGYVPRNKKLFCYPYKYLEVDNSEGSQKEYYYEYFNTLPDTTSTGKFKLCLESAFNASAEVSISPIDYKGYRTEGVETPLRAERISMTHFPMCAWGYNSYMAYLAQKNAYLEQDFDKGLLSGMAFGAIGGGMAGSLAGPLGMAVGAVAGGVGGAIKPVMDNLIENNVRPMAPATSKGSPATDLQFSANEKRFHILKKCITKNYAIMLDSYFDMYGYAVKQHGVPNMNARPHWTYVKTISCSVGGNIPADDARDIETIFDNGIRFWKDHTEIGNYSLNNAPA